MCFLAFSWFFKRCSWFFKRCRRNFLGTAKNSNIVDQDVAVLVRYREHSITDVNHRHFQKIGIAGCWFGEFLKTVFSVGRK